MLETVFSRSEEFACPFLHKVAVVGDVLKLPTAISANQIGQVFRPMQLGQSGQLKTREREIIKRAGISFALLLSLPYHLTVGLGGYSLKALTFLSEKNITIISPSNDPTVYNIPEQIGITTFNTALLPDVINELKRSDGLFIHPIKGKIEERVDGIAQAILQYDEDIVCLQEVFDLKGARRLADRVSTQYPYLAYNAGPGALLLNSGLMVLSKFPIKEAHFDLYKDSVGSDWWSNKGVMEIVLEIGEGKQVAVLNTHLNSAVGLFGWIEGVDKIRAKQFNQMAAMFKTLSNESDHVVICGDFNTSRQGKWVIDGETVDSLFEIKSDRIDHVMYSKKGTLFDLKSITCEINKMNDTSDHPAVVTSVKLLQSDS